MAQSYANPEGTGNRTSAIIVVGVGSPGLAGGGASVFVDGDKTTNVTFFNTLTALSFQFAIPRVIDECKFYQQNTATHGTWKWQGTNDGVTWVDIGGSFTLGGATLQTQTTLNGNTTAYGAYRIVIVSGASSSSPYIYEFEFRIDTPSPPAGAITVVQGTPKVNASSVAAVSCAFSAAPVVGHAIVLFVNVFRPAGQAIPSTCTDTFGNSYTLVTTQTNGTVATAIFYCAAVTATGSGFTVTAGSAFASTYWVAKAIEVSAALTVDRFVGATGASTAPNTGSTAALTGTSGFQVACHAISSAHTAITVTPTWTQQFEELASTQVAGEADTRFLAATAGSTPSCSWVTSNTGSWAAVIVAFKSAGVTVPNVVGLTEAAATTAITAAGLVKGTVTSASSSSVAAGLVISQVPAAGGTASPGSAVNLTVSSGPPDWDLIVAGVSQKARALVTGGLSIRLS